MFTFGICSSLVCALICAGFAVVTNKSIIWAFIGGLIFGIFAVAYYIYSFFSNK